MLNYSDNSNAYEQCAETQWTSRKRLITPKKGRTSPKKLDQKRFILEVSGLESARQRLAQILRRYRRLESCIWEQSCDLIGDGFVDRYGGRSEVKRAAEREWRRI